MIPVMSRMWMPKSTSGELPLLEYAGLWLDASDSSTITLSGTDVTGWRCKITDEDFVQSVPTGYCPSIDTSNSVFPHDCVDFERGTASKWLGPANPVTLTIPFTCFMVAQWPYYGPSNDYWALGIYDSQSQSALVNGSRSIFGYGTIAISRSFQILSNTPTGYSYRNGNVGDTSAQKALAMFVIPSTTPSETEIEYAGSALTESVFGSFGSDYAFEAVGSPDATYKSKGLLAEVICYSGALSSSDRTLVIDYLTSKWEL